MALIRSSLLTELSGSIGGTTYARSRGGLYARNRTVPINPQTVAQGTVRSMLGSLSMGWNALTESQRNAWNVWAQGITFTNRLGETYAPSGRQAYMSLSQNLNIIGVTPFDDPPATTIAPVLDIAWLNIIASHTAGLLDTFTVQDVGPHAGDMMYQLKFSPVMDVARQQSYRNRNRGQGQFKGDMVPALALLTPYVETFNGGSAYPVATGQIINVQARCIDPATGLSCAYIATNVVITET